MKQSKLYRIEREERKMSILQINNLSKGFAGQELFDNISLTINMGEKVALIGKNGTGKTTLLKIILGEETADSGEVFILNKIKIGYLSQKIIESEKNTLFNECISVFQKIVDIEKQMHELAKKMRSDYSEEALNRYSQKEHLFQIEGGYEYLTKIDLLLSKFGFNKDDYNRAIESFSGGEKTRIAFAKLLMIEPDLLILDEPTNHMDIEIIEWLESYLKTYRGAVLVVTHDKYFINKVVNKIYDLENEDLELYLGNYDFYEAEKTLRYEQLLAKYTRQKKDIEHLQSFVDRFRYKATKAKSAQDRIKKLNRIERIELPKSRTTKLNLSFKSSRPTNVHILEVENLVIGYDSPLLKPISFKMRGFEKIGIIGNNGTGKTTLIRTLMQEIPALSGEYKFYKKLKFGYFDQNITYFDPNQTLIDTVHNLYPVKTLYEVRSDLARVGFKEEDVFKKVMVLSGGELVKLRILLLMLENADILVLDEPTNHLDIDSKTLVEDIFEAYKGPIIFISHDRYFINKVATKIISLSDEAKIYEGNYEQYLEDTKKMEIKPKQVKKNQNRPNYQKEKQRIEKEIHEMEKDIGDLKKALFNPDIYQNHVKYHEYEDLINQKEQILEELFQDYEEVEKLCNQND
jgi:ATP-binding cassette subfamily F protein 3